MIRFEYFLLEQIVLDETSNLADRSEIVIMNLSILMTFALVTIAQSEAKNFTLCEFAKEVYSEHYLPLSEVIQHVCVADTQSGLRTSGSLSASFLGIYRFGKKWWCGEEGVCLKTCDKFIDDDIADDVRCASFALNNGGLRTWSIDESSCRVYFDKLAKCVPIWQRDELQ